MVDDVVVSVPVMVVDPIVLVVVELLGSIEDVDVVEPDRAGVVKPDTDVLVELKTNPLEVVNPDAVDVLEPVDVLVDVSL